MVDTVSPPLCPGKTLPEMLHPPLESSAQQRPVGEGPEQGHQDSQRAGAHFIQKQAERVGVVHHGEEKALGRPSSSLTGLIKRWEKDFLYGHIVTEQKAMVLN